MLKKGDPVLIDNGHLRLEVLQVAKKTVKCRVITGGVLGENKGINLPNAPITLPALTDKDLADLKIASALNVDYVALSFVRSEEDVFVIKNWLARSKKNIFVIAKIEKPGAVNRSWAILSAAHGIMVARGDLGIEMGVEKVPVVQKQLIDRANITGSPVITATQMLESMIESPVPTRAEVSDVANAVFDGTDAVMLSGETAVGKYPVEVVKVMSRIIKEAELHSAPVSFDSSRTTIVIDTPVRAITHAAYNAAQDTQAKAIWVFTRSGKTAQLISKLRPGCPVVALVPSEHECGKLTLLRGVIPVAMPHSKTTDTMIREANRAVLALSLVKRGDTVVIVSGRQALPGARYMTKIHCAGED
jgi:pyruvate kinase